LVESGAEVSDEELLRREFPRARCAAQSHPRVEKRGYRWHLSARIGVTEAAADCAAMAGADETDRPDRRGQHRLRPRGLSMQLQVPLSGHRPDHDLVLGDLDPGDLGDLVKVTDPSGPDLS